MNEGWQQNSVTMDIFESISWMFDGEIKECRIGHVLSKSLSSETDDSEMIAIWFKLENNENRKSKKQFNSTSSNALEKKSFCNVKMQSISYFDVSHFNKNTSV